MRYISDVKYLQKVDSTNTFLKSGQFTDYAVAYTFNQTRGRGRSNKEWTTFPGKNLALSMVHYPDGGFTGLNWFVALFSVSLIELLESYGMKGFFIKWPNDIYEGRKKLAGILTESVWRGVSLDRVVTGIGINVNTTQGELETLSNDATSILMESENTIELEIFVKDFIKILDCNLDYLIKRDYDYLKDRWLCYMDIIGKEVEYSDNGKVVRGFVKGINNDAGLKIASGDMDVDIISGDLYLK